MKREIPPAVMAVVAVLGLAIIASVWFFSGGSGQLTSGERKLAEEQSRTRAEREAAAASGAMSVPGSEQEARARMGSTGQ